MLDISAFFDSIGNKPDFLPRMRLCRILSRSSSRVAAVHEPNVDMHRDRCRIMNSTHTHSSNVRDHFYLYVAGTVVQLVVVCCTKITPTYSYNITTCVIQALDRLQTWGLGYQARQTLFQLISKDDSKPPTYRLVNHNRRQTVVSNLTRVLIIPAFFDAIMIEPNIISFLS